MSDENNTNNPTPTNTPQPSADNGKTAAILAYLLVGVIWFFADENLQKNAFAKFHVKQASVLMIASICGSIILGMIPFIGWLVLPFWSLAGFAFFVLGIINAAQNEMKELPFIGSYAKLLKF